MSCPDGSCKEPAKRQRALIMLGLMMLVFILLSAISFMKSRGQVTPDQVAYGTFSAEDGKRVFQAYNAMGCHTLVGNGAYFGPDLTKEYALAGPAWLAAFLPSAGGWPTEGAVKAQLLNMMVAEDAGVSTIEEYYAKFPGAKERVERRGGGTTHMPNLPFSSDEIGMLIAYLKYASALNTEGWPPEVRAGSLQRRLELAHGRTAAPATAPAPEEPAVAEADSAEADEAALLARAVAHGEKLVKEVGCLACHSVSGSSLVGPGWGGLFGSPVKLTDGTTVTADEAYLVESILHPNASFVEGFPQGTMPVYEGMLSKEDAEAIVSYIKTLKN